MVDKHARLTLSSEKKALSTSLSPAGADMNVSGAAALHLRGGGGKQSKMTNDFEDSGGGQGGGGQQLGIRPL